MIIILTTWPTRLLNYSTIRFSHKFLFHKVVDDALRGIGFTNCFRIDDEFGRSRLFIRRRNAGVVLYDPCTRLLIHPFRVALLALSETTFDIDFYEISLIEKNAHRVPVFPVRGYEGGEDDDTRIDHQLRNLADPPDVLLPVLGTEPEIGIEAVPYVVAVEDICPYPALEQFLLDEIRNRRFPRCRKSGKPYESAPVFVEAIPVLPFHKSVMPYYVIFFYENPFFSFQLATEGTEYSEVKKTDKKILDL